MTEAERFWSACPYRRLGWREGTDGRVVVLRPRLGESRLGRWVGTLLRDPYYRIRLDDFGTFVWKACDGDTPLDVIAQQMHDLGGLYSRCYGRVLLRSVQIRNRESPVFPESSC